MLIYAKLLSVLRLIYSAVCKIKVYKCVYVLLLPFLLLRFSAISLACFSKGKDCDETCMHVLGMNSEKCSVQRLLMCEM